MDRRNKRLTITQADLDQMRDELAAVNPDIKRARVFLARTNGVQVASLSPELLCLFGERLLEPEKLLQGPGLLIWQNLSRQKGGL